MRTGCTLRLAAPYDKMLAKMNSEEVAALTPLEDVVHVPDMEEEWKLLENVVDAETVAQIRNDVG